MLGRSPVAAAASLSVSLKPVVGTRVIVSRRELKANFCRTRAGHRPLAMCCKVPRKSTRDARALAIRKTSAPARSQSAATFGAAAAFFCLPGTVLTLNDEEGFYRVALWTEMDRPAEAFESFEIRQVIADFDAVCRQFTRLAGDMVLLHGADVHTNDLVDIGVIHARLDVGGQAGGFAQKRLQLRYELFGSRGFHRRIERRWGDDRNFRSSAKDRRGNQRRTTYHGLEQPLALHLADHRNRLAVISPDHHSVGIHRFQRGDLSADIEVASIERNRIFGVEDFDAVGGKYAGHDLGGNRSGDRILGVVDDRDGLYREGLLEIGNRGSGKDAFVHGVAESP